MSRLRADIWCGAFVRRNNDAGQMCVIARKGDPIAGQIWIEFDHLDGTSSLLAPAPSILLQDGQSAQDWYFQLRIDRQPSFETAQRLMREAEFDPDFWHIAVDARKLDETLNIISADT